MRHLAPAGSVGRSVKSVGAVNKSPEERHLSVDNIDEQAGEPKIPPSGRRFLTLGSVELVGISESELRSAIGQPKRLALLAYLALASPLRAHRRDSLVAMFWPEADNDQARHSLRQALHSLRRALGPDVLVSRGDGDVAFEPSALWCDAHAFERALDAGDAQTALSVYRGDLLQGFYVSDVSPDFERWLDGERSRLRSRAARAAWSLADAAAHSGDGPSAADWARRALGLSPDDEGSLRRFMTLLDSLGDRVGALRAYDDFARRLAAEFEAEPSAETQALIATIRAREQPRLATSSAAAASIGKSTASAPLRRDSAPGAALPDRRAMPTAHRRPRRRVLLLATVGIVAVVFAVSTKWTSPGSRTAQRPVIAVGYIDDRTGDSAGTVSVLRELIATDLARVNGLQVVSHGRLLEVLGQLGAADETPLALTDAVRRAGASERIEGALFRRDGALRLDLRRVDVRSGVVREAYTAQGADAFVLAARATSEIADDFAFPPPSPATPLGEVTAGSLVARRLFEEGLRAYYQQTDHRNAYRLFVAALAEDSAFAMAAYYAFLSGTEYEKRAGHLAQALRTASHASDHERLIIRVASAQAQNDSSYLSLAEQLASRYPTEPLGELALAVALVADGDFMGSVPHFRAVITSDSLSLRGKTPLCRACEALAGLTVAYASADSFEAVERTAREWVRLQPRSSQPWSLLASVLSQRGRRQEADSLLLRAAELQPEIATYPLASAQFAIRSDDYLDADRLLLDRVQYGTFDVRKDAIWWLLISRRHQGRLRDALVLANNLAREGSEEGPASGAALARAQVLFEMGRYSEAATLFESLTTHPPRHYANRPGVIARHLSWTLTHVATASAAAGDTQRLGLIADSIAKLARKSAFGRDRHLPHHIRGLLWLKRGDASRAVEEFRRAVFSPTYGYTRTNLELGRVLLSLGRAREAIEILGSALHGSTDASNFYVTRVDLHEVLARAFEAAGERDSAAAHYRVVAESWQSADPLFTERAVSARTKARELAARR